MKYILVTKILIETQIVGTHPALIKKTAKTTEDAYISSKEIPNNATVRLRNPYRVVYSVDYDRSTKLLWDKELIPLENE